jgi:hypothetical protein
MWKALNRLWQRLCGAMEYRDEQEADDMQW